MKLSLDFAISGKKAKESYGFLYRLQLSELTNHDLSFSNNKKTKDKSLAVII